MPGLLRHVCTESCYKYSEAGSKSWKICRHGFYHVVHLWDGCRVRRKGKALRPCLHIGSAAEAEYGMRGRLRPIQLSPFECQTSFGGLVAGRHNLDVQGLWRVLDPALWLDAEDHLPHIGVVNDLGYMASWEWTGAGYEARATAPNAAVSWLPRARRLSESFRSRWAAASEGIYGATQVPQAEGGDAEEGTGGEDLAREARLCINEAFCDGINTGFYVNNYTTKPGPGLAQMLEELQKGHSAVGVAPFVSVSSTLRLVAGVCGHLSCYALQEYNG